MDQITKDLNESHEQKSNHCHLCGLNKLHSITRTWLSTPIIKQELQDVAKTRDLNKIQQVLDEFNSNEVEFLLKRGVCFYCSTSEEIASILDDKLELTAIIHFSKK